MHGTLPAPPVSRIIDRTFDEVAAATNLRGVIIWATVMIAAGTTEIASGLFDAAYRYATVWELAGHAAAIAGAAVLLRLPGGRPRPRWHGSASPAMLVALLLLMQHTIATATSAGLFEDCYALVLLGIPVVCLFSTAQAAAILVPTTLVYLLVVMAPAPLPYEVKVAGMRNAVLACGAAIIACKMIHDPRRREWHQRVLIEARGRELEEHYARLDELMAVTAHDLRSPLLGLRNLVRLTLERAARNPDAAITSLRLADRSIASILGLVSGLLDAHEAERGLMEVSASWDLAAMLADLIGRAAPLADAAGVHIALDVPDDPMTMALDHRAISRVVDNLLANAIRFTPAGERIRVRAAPNGAGGVVVGVSDPGPGVSPDEVERIFDKFYRGDMAQGEHQHGSGLGLFIARQTARNLGGELTYRPNASGGATFALTVPHGAIAAGNVLSRSADDGSGIADADRDRLF